jgi:hypothetical protein
MAGNAREPGLIAGAMVISVLMLGSPADLTRLVREGWFKAVPGAPDRYRLIEVVQGYVRALHAQAGTATTREVGALLEISGERIRQLAAEGWFKSVGKDRWNRDEVVRGYCKFLRAEDRRSTRSAAENRVRDAKAREIEMRLAERGRELIAFEEAEGALETIVGMVRTEMGGVAARVTRDLNLRRAIEKAIDDGLARIVTLLAKEVAALRTGNSAAFAVEPLDA